MTSTWADRINLPGPTNFAADVAAGIEEGKSVLVVLPAHLVDSGASEHVIELLRHRAHAHEVDPRRGRDALHKAIGSCFDPNERWRSSPDEWRDLAALQSWRGECVVARAWDYDVNRLLTRWSTLMSEQRLDPYERPRFLLVARREDIDESQLVRIDLLHLAVYWWWGVIDRLDTEAALARGAALSQRDPLRRAIMAEVAAWDLDLGDYLLTGWSGDVAQLLTCLTEYRPEKEALRQAIVSGTPSSAPAAAERDAWDAGVLDVWDGSRRREPWTVADTEFRSRVWRAQNRVFMPRLDERRAELEREFLQAAPEGVRKLIVNEDGVCELGSMHWATWAHGVRLAPQARSALSVLTKFRNCLAHGRPADDDLLGQVRKHL